MSFRFKVGDRVRINPSNSMFAVLTGDKFVGKEGEVTQLGGTATPDEGAVVTNEEFPCGDESYGEHGHWFPDKWLELVDTSDLDKLWDKETDG